MDDFNNFFLKIKQTILIIKIAFNHINAFKEDL